VGRLLEVEQEEEREEEQHGENQQRHLREPAGGAGRGPDVAGGGLLHPVGRPRGCGGTGRGHGVCWCWRWWVDARAGVERIPISDEDRNE